MKTKTKMNVLRYKDGTRVKRGDVIRPDYEAVVVDLFVDEDGHSQGLVYWIPILPDGSRSPLHHVFTRDENMKYKDTAGAEGGGHCRSGNLQTASAEHFAHWNKVKE